MTKDKDFKKLVRARMTETGENFTTARTALLTANQSAETASESYIDPQIARFRTKTLKTFMPDGRIVSIPTKRRALVIVLIEVLAALDPDRVYDEKQLGAILGSSIRTSLCSGANSSTIDCLDAIPTPANIGSTRTHLPTPVHKRRRWPASRYFCAEPATAYP